MGKDKSSKNNRVHFNNMEAEFSREFSAQATNNGRPQNQDKPNSKK
jgi:hypothetical protein